MGIVVLKCMVLKENAIWKVPFLCFFAPTSQHPNIPTSQHPNISTSQHPNIPTSQHPNIPTSQHPNTPTSQHPNIQTQMRIFGKSEIQFIPPISQYPNNKPETLEIADAYVKDMSQTKPVEGWLVPSGKMVEYRFLSPLFPLLLFCVSWFAFYALSSLRFSAPQNLRRSWEERSAHSFLFSKIIQNSLDTRWEGRHIPSQIYVPLVPTPS
jgi:hypothetical protein